MSSITTSVRIKYETWISCDGGTIAEFKEIPTGWYHVTDGMDLKVLAIDTGKEKKNIHTKKSTASDADGINKYLEDVETVFRDEDSVMNSFKDRNNICIVGIDLG